MLRNEASTTGLRFFAIAQNHKHDAHWYAVQVSDTTMMPIELMLVTKNKKNELYTSGKRD